MPVLLFSESQARKGDSCEGTRSEPRTPMHPSLPVHPASNATSPAADIPAPGQTLHQHLDVEMVFCKNSSFPPQVFPYTRFSAPLQSGRRVAPWLELKTSADPPTPHLPSYYSISLPHRVVVRTTPLSGSQKTLHQHQVDLAQPQASPDPKLTPSFSSIQTLGSRCHSPPCQHLLQLRLCYRIKA